MHNVEASIMAFSMGDDTHTAHVTTTRNHSNDSSIETDEVGDFAGGQLNLDGIVDLNGRIRISDPVLQRMISAPLRRNPTKTWSNG